MKYALVGGYNENEINLKNIYINSKEFRILAVNTLLFSIVEDSLLKLTKLNLWNETDAITYAMTMKVVALVNYNVVT